MHCWVNMLHYKLLFCDCYDWFIFLRAGMVKNPADSSTFVLVTVDVSTLLSLKELTITNNECAI